MTIGQTPLASEYQAERPQIRISHEFVSPETADVTTARMSEAPPEHGTPSLLYSTSHESGAMVFPDPFVTSAVAPQNPRDDASFPNPFVACGPAWRYASAVVRVFLMAISATSANDTAVPNESVSDVPT